MGFEELKKESRDYQQSGAIETMGDVDNWHPGVDDFILLDTSGDELRVLGREQSAGRDGKVRWFSAVKTPFLKTPFLRLFDTQIAADTGVVAS